LPYCCSARRAHLTSASAAAAAIGPVFAAVDVPLVLIPKNLKTAPGTRDGRHNSALQPAPVRPVPSCCRTTATLGLLAAPASHCSGTSGTYRCATMQSVQQSPACPTSLFSPPLCQFPALPRCLLPAQMSRAAFNFTCYTICDARLLLCLRRVVGVGFYPWSAGHCQRPLKLAVYPPARRRAVLGVGRDLRNQRDGEPRGMDGPALVW